MTQTIKNYDEIIINENTFVMMDIDDTTIKFEKLNKNWWKDNEPNSLEKWLKIIQEDKPILLDEIEFFKLLDKIKVTNSELIFITARYNTLDELTYQQLIHCGIPIKKEQIYHSYPKGKKILEIIENKIKETKESKEKVIQNIIFIDDHLDNIEDAQKYLKDYSVNYYLIEHINLK